jgi:hypothetical protein
MEFEDFIREREKSVPEEKEQSHSFVASKASGDFRMQMAAMVIGDARKGNAKTS